MINGLGCDSPVYKGGILLLGDLYAHIIMIGISSRKKASVTFA